MVINIICPAIMLTKSSKKKYRWVLSMEAKRKLWLRLPYPLRLRIEHGCFVASVIMQHESQIQWTAMQVLKKPLYRKQSAFWKEIQKLNNPYSAFTNLPVSDEDAAKRINNFLSRFTHA